MKVGEYHRKTSYTRGHLGIGWWEKGDPPSIFKSYPGASTITLPRDLSFPSVSLEEVLNEKAGLSQSGIPITLTTLSVFLFLSYGITAIIRDERFSFRTVPSAGALYPAELFLSLSGISDLHPGIYHYNPAHHSLVEIARFEKRETPLPFVQTFVSGIFYRSSSKYRERAFRYVLMDGGHLLEQVFLAGKAVGLHPVKPTETFRLPYGISSWEDFISVDPDHETVLGTAIFENPPVYGTINYTMDQERLRSSSKVAKRCPVPPIIIEVSKTTGGGLFIAEEYLSSLDKSSFPDYEPLRAPFSNITLSRRSRRNFLIRPVSHKVIFSFLRGIAGLVSSDLRVFFAVERCGNELPNGIYEVICEGKNIKLRSLKYGSFLSRCAHASLDQMWLSDAVLHVIIAASIEQLEKQFGPSSYRNALLQAGRIGQRIYLIAEALELACCGIGAFYDDELRKVLDLPTEWDVLYLLGVGVRGR